MKKVICLCLVFLFCFTAVGYAAEETVAAEVSVEDLFGKEENGVYENTFLGLGFNGDGWHFNTEEEIEALNNFSKTLLTEEYAEMIDQINSMYLMMAVAPDGSNINITLTNLGDTASVYQLLGMEVVAQNSVDTSKQIFEASGYKNVAVEYAKIAIEDQEYDGMKTSFQMQGMDMLSTLFMFLCDRYMVTVTVTGFTEEAINEGFQRLYHLK